MLTGIVLSTSFKVVRLIGRGGMGEVFLARELTTGQQVALKRVRDSTEYPATQQLFREAAICAQLRHPNIVGYLDHGKDESGPYIIFEYVEGTSALRLARTAEDRGANLPMAVVLQIITDIARALEYAHHSDVEVLHRDVSPDNILVTRDGISKLSDFGLAHLVETTRFTQTGSVRGKIGYLAPELFEGGKPSRQSDLYSLAVTAYCLFSGRMPFRGANDAEIMRAVLYTSPLSIGAVRGDVSKAVAEWIDAALARQPSERPLSAQELIASAERELTEYGPSVRSIIGRAVDDVLENHGDAERLEALAEGSAQTHTAQQRAPRRRNARRVLMASSATLLALSAVLFFFLPPRGQRAASVEPSEARSPVTVADLEPKSASISTPDSEVDAGHAIFAPTDVSTSHRQIAKHPRKLDKGTLAIKVVPWAMVFIDGKPVGPTPINPVPMLVGQHTVVLVNDELGVTRKEIVKIRPGKTFRLEARLEPSRPD